MLGEMLKWEVWVVCAVLTPDHKFRGQDFEF